MAQIRSHKRTPRKIFSGKQKMSILENASPEIHRFISVLEHQIERFSEIGLALSRQKNMPTLLEMILEEARRLTNADGGTFYMMSGDKKLRFEIVRTDSLNFHMGGTSGVKMSFSPINLYLDDGTPNHHMIAAHAGLTGEVVNIPDAYKAEGFDFSGTKAFDKKTGYRSKSFLTVPLKNHLDEIIGVIQLINAQDPETGQVIQFSQDNQKLVESLSSQAAVAITNNQLIQDLQKLFESFIQMIASAIDAKSPYTGAHCARVPEIAMMLAEAVNNIKEGPYAHVHFSEQDMYELKIAAWLHDCGKVVTPEYIVDKSTKLETIYDRINTVRARFEVLKRDEEIKLLNKQIVLEREGKTDEIKKAHKRFEEQIAQFKDDLKFLETANIGGEFMEGEKVERVKKIARYTWDLNGKKENLVSDNEVYNLCIPRGTLTSEERKIINDHIVVTIKMLNKLPFPKNLRRVPEFAGGHHEKLDGTGYPNGLTKNEMSIQARIMAIADIFEALTAKDRPYKKGNTLSQAMRIMEAMKKDAHIDPYLFEIFVKAKIYEKYARNYLSPEQIDKVMI